MIRFETFERRTLRGKRFFFRIVAEGNNEILAQSQAYKSKQARATAITRIAHGSGVALIQEGVTR